MAGFRKFQAWEACFKLTLDVYRASASWPRAELYGLVSQVRRAALSAGTNIAEGSGKHSRHEFSRFIDIANGSLAELEHLLLVARELAYLSPTGWHQLEATRAHAARLTHGLFQSIRKPPA